MAFSFFRRSQALPEYVREYLEAPRPDPHLPWREVPYTVLDVETTGLDARRDALLAIGLIEIDAGRIVVERRWYTLVRPPGDVVVQPNSIRIHGLLVSDVADAPPPGEVLPVLLRRLQGRVLVVHFADVDVGFLNQALKQHYGARLRGPAIDTARMASQLRFADRFIQGAAYIQDDAASTPALNLRALAEQANLPVYAEHNALNDALTTAQLFLYQATRFEQRGTPTLRHLLRKGGCLR